MRIYTNQRFLIWVVGLFFMLALMGSNAMAQEKVKIAGKVTAAITDQKVFEFGDVPGHKLSLNLSEGTNVSSGPVKFLDSASVVNYSFGDLIKGNGPQNGYISMASGADTVFSKWQHQVKTTLAADGTPLTSFEGTVQFEKGTGQFKNIQGQATFKGAFTTKTAYSVDWQCEYSIAK